MKSNILLQQLELRLEQLARSVAPLAERRARRARFDQQLFHCQSQRLGDYLLEIDNTLAQLKHSVAAQHTAQLTWLAERVVLQIGALQREVATQPIERDKASSPQQKLAQHQEFERRLLAMIAEREQQLGQQETLVQQQALQREIVALEGRLQRCRAALSVIEMAG